MLQYMLIKRSMVTKIPECILPLPGSEFLGSKFSRIVPENKNESCGTSAIRDRSVSNGKVEISTVSMIIRPV